MSLYPRPNSSKSSETSTGRNEFEILKAAHKFLREDDETNGPQTWEQKMAVKYESSLYREFAVCDLKHYKTGNFALRFRTEDEVLSGAGESSCGNTRCEDHSPREDGKPIASLTTLELPFAYTEHGEAKSTLVKVVLCKRCVKKLMYKRKKEKQKVEDVFRVKGTGVKEEVNTPPYRDSSFKEIQEGSEHNTKGQRRYHPYREEPRQPRSSR